jgi:hypothetical protein
MSSLNLKSNHGNRKGTKDTRTQAHRTRFDPIYALMINWLVDFLWWKVSTHIIDQTNTKRTNRCGLNNESRLKQEGKRQDRKQDKHNLKKTQIFCQIPKDTRRIRDLLSQTKSRFLHKFTICGPLPLKKTRGRKHRVDGGKKVEDMREMEAPSSSFIGARHPKLTISTLSQST